jgi:ELWxxDGT repeat protein
MKKPRIKHIGVYFIILFSTMFISSYGQMEKIEMFFERPNGEFVSDFEYHISWESKSVVIFKGNDDAHGRELWVTDGTDEGTHLLKDINPGQDYFDDPLSSDPMAYAILGDYAYFSALNADYGYELWKTDGTTEGTVMLKDINSGNASGVSTEQLFLYNNELYFAGANNTETGEELWKTNGTSAGTVLVKNINPTSEQGANPREFTIYNGLLYFIAESVLNHKELWVTDGTNEGTQMLDYAIYDELLDIRDLVVCNNLLFFKGYTENNGIELYRTDGTSDGTFMLTDINTEGDGVYYGEQVIAYNNKVYFSGASIEFGEELWVSDGTSEGTVMLKDINPGMGDYSALSSWPFRFTIFDNILFFCAREETHVQELWMTDGTTEGTAMFYDLNPNGTSFANLFTVCNDRLYFEALYPDYKKLVSIGSSTDEPIVHYGDDFSYGSITDFYQFFILNNKLHFNALLDVSKGQQLYKLVEMDETTITISDQEINLLTGETMLLSAVVEPSNPGDVIVWESLSADIATVSNSGLVTALSGGQTEIVASLQGAAISDTCIVNVSPNGILSNTLRSEISIYPNPNNGSFKLSLPQEFTDGQIIISDLSGKLVVRKQINGGVNSFSLNITSGIYLVKTLSNSQINTIQLHIN